MLSGSETSTELRAALLPSGLTPSRRRRLLRDSDRLLAALEQHFMSGTRRLEPTLTNEIVGLAGRLGLPVARPRSLQAARRIVFAVQELLGAAPDEEEDLAAVLIELLRAAELRLRLENARLQRRIEALRPGGLPASQEGVCQAEEPAVGELRSDSRQPVRRARRRGKEGRDDLPPLAA